MLKLMIFMNDYNNHIMKRSILLFLIILISPAIAVKAQNTNLEKLNNFKIGFFTRKLNLTSQEAEKFWPAYNDYQDQRNQIQVEKLKLNRNFNENENTMTDAQIADIGDKFIDCLVRETNLAVSFHKKLKELLPAAKVIKYYQAENQYKIQLLEELKDVKQQQGMRRRNF